MADLPNPKGRKELYEYNATQGITTDMPDPKSREELYLKTLAEQGGGGGGGGTTNYNALSNKPKINNVELSGNKTTEDLIPIGDGLVFNEDGELEAPGSGSGAVESVNGKTGEVTLNAQDVGALPADTPIPENLSDLEEDSTHRTVTDTEKDTWNGKSDFSGDYGDLTNKPDIPSNTSDLTNDSGFIDNTANDLLNYYLKTETYTKTEVDGALTSKVDTVTGKGLSTNDYTDADKAEVAKVADKADSEDVINNASYDSANHLILFKNDETTLFSLDAAAFVKDGMIDTVEITGGNLVITFNTDAGKQDISIPLTDIFDPANYYNKTATDALLADKTDKVSGATNGNFAGLDANGNLTDSGKKASDFGTADEIADIVNVYGAKNLCVYPFYHTTRTVNGITFTDNGDGTVTATGTATDRAVFQVSIRLENGKLILPNGEYEVNGCPSGGSTNSYWMVMSRTSGGEAVNYGNDTGNGMTATLNGDDFSNDNVHFQIAIVIKAGYEITTPLVFKPMVRLASIKDGTYVPYAPTNAKLNEEKMSYADNGVLGAKNLNSMPYSTSTNPVTENGITWTRNADGSVTANGTATANTFYYCHYRLHPSNKFVLKNGNYIFSGCPSGGGDGKYWAYCDCTKNGSLRILGVDYGNGVSITLNGDDNDANSVKLSVVLTVRSGYTANNLTFYPMLRLAEDTDTTYQPYAMTNKELTDNKVNNTTIAPIEDGATASQTRNAGTYIMRRGQFYKVTQTIAKDSAITEGVNIESTSVSGEISEINSNLLQTTIDTYTTNAYGNIILTKQGYTPISATVLSNDGNVFINLAGTNSVDSGFVYKLVNGITPINSTQVTVKVTWAKSN